MSKKSQKEETIVDVQEVYSKSEMFIDKNRKIIFGIIGGIALLVAGYYAYNKLYMLPREQKAAGEMWMAQVWFNEENSELALAGDDVYAGFEEIADKYSGTNAAKLANYYMGIIYRDKGTAEDFQTALDYFLVAADLKDQAIGPLAAGNAGDMYVELGDNAKALECFEDAADRSDNVFISSTYLMKAAQLCMLEGNNDPAKKYLSRIIEDYPTSSQFADAEKYLAAIGG